MSAYVLGIDLGTTNSVLGYAPLAAEKPDVQLLPIPQLVAPGVVESRTTLPSFLYLAAEHETGSGAFDPPWQKAKPTRSVSEGRIQARSASEGFVVGEFARRQSAEN